MSVAAVAKTAYDEAAKAFPEVIKSATLTRVTNGVYDPATGGYGQTTANHTCRALFDTATPIIDLFPDYTAGPKDNIVYLEGLSIEPVEGDEISVDGLTRIVQAVGNIVQANSFYAVVAR